MLSAGQMFKANRTMEGAEFPRWNFLQLMAVSITFTLKRPFGKCRNCFKLSKRMMFLFYENGNKGNSLDF